VSDSGVVAILFTDLVGSTELLARLGDDDAEVLRREHFEILRHEVARAGGEEVKSTGDGLMVVFHSPIDAVACAVAIQQAVDRRNRAFRAWREGDVAAALSFMTRAGRRLVETGAWWQAALILSDEAEVAGDAGDAAGAAGAAARLDTCARMLDLDLYRALAGTAAAWAHVAAGQSGAAAAVGQRAVDELRPLGYRAFLARALDVLGRAHGGVDPERAAEARTEAARLFDQCGAGWRRDRILGVAAGSRTTLTGGDR
jgi:hypothetical protein